MNTHRTETLFFAVMTLAVVATVGSSIAAYLTTWLSLALPFS